MQNIGYEHILEIDWNNLNLDISFTRKELSKHLGIAEKEIDNLKQNRIISPIIDVDGEEIYPKSWYKKLEKYVNCKSKRALNKQFPSGLFLTAWSTEEIMPRTKQLINHYCNYEKVTNLVNIWSVFKKFIQEPIADPVGDEVYLEMIEAHPFSRQNIFSFCFRRQFETYTLSDDSLRGFEHQAYVQFTIELVFGLTDDIKEKSLNNTFFRITNKDELRELEYKTESQEVFKILTNRIPSNLNVEFIPQ